MKTVSTSNPTVGLRRTAVLSTHEVSDGDAGRELSLAD